MVTPELRWPITAATFASTSFCATRVPSFGSPWSSSLTMRKLTGLPPITSFLAFACSMASATPFSSSLPWCAMPPVRGPATPIATTCAADAAGATGTPVAGGASVFPQAAHASAAANAWRYLMGGSLPHAVAAVLLGAVERGVGLRDEARRSRVAEGHARCHAHAERHDRRHCRRRVRDRTRLAGLAQALRERERRRAIGAGNQHHELLAAVT